jgi:hypothetical protein
VWAAALLPWLVPAIAGRSLRVAGGEIGGGGGAIPRQSAGKIRSNQTNQTNQTL